MFLQKPVKPDYKKILLGGLLTAVLILGLDMGCIFRLVTGVPCPGCGMTRAHLAALSLDFRAAFFYHPLWFLPAPLVLIQIFFPGGLFCDRRWNHLAAMLLGILVMGTYVVRMLLLFPDTPPMEYQFHSLFGWLGRLLGLLE